MSSALRNRFAQSHQDIALIDGASGRQLTYAEVWLLATASAEAMARRGANEGDYVALSLNNGPEFICCFFGCLIGGYVAVPLNRELSENDISSILATVKPSLVLDEPPAEVFADETLAAGTPAGAPSSLDPADVKFSSDGVCAVFFTSGTTGQPKGVRHTLGSMVGNVLAFNSLVGLGPQTRMYHVLPMAYMAGFLNTVLSPLMAGGSIIIGPRFTPQGGLDFWSLPQRLDANTIWLTPTIAATLQRLARDPETAKQAASGFQQVFCGTAPLHNALRKSFQTTFGVPLQESYGTSELLLISAQTRDDASRFVDVGRTLAGVKLDTSKDDDGHDELVVESPFASPGYITTDGMIDIDTAPNGMIRTGDVAEINDGRLTITGRLKDLIIRGGVNVSPIAIENALADVEGVAHVAAIGLPHEFWGESIAVCLEVHPGADHDDLVRRVKATARERLAAAQRPDRIEICDELPRSVNGKIQKHLLRAELAQ